MSRAEEIKAKIAARRAQAPTADPTPDAPDPQVADALSTLPEGLRDKIKEQLINPPEVVDGLAASVAKSALVTAGEELDEEPTKRKPKPAKASKAAPDYTAVLERQAAALEALVSVVSVQNTALEALVSAVEAQAKAAVEQTEVLGAVAEGLVG